MTTLAVTSVEFAPLPGLNLLSHRFKVPLHPIHSDRHAIDQRERFRMLRKHRPKHTWNNVSNFGIWALRNGVAVRGFEILTIVGELKELFLARPSRSWNRRVCKHDHKRRRGPTRA
jgi:hypothetical protein